MDYRQTQKIAWANKVAKGFDTGNVEREFNLLVEEVGEAHKAHRMGDPGYAEELADIAIYTANLAEMTGVDLQAAVEAKLAKNAQRTYAPLTNGEMAKQEPPCPKDPEAPRYGVIPLAAAQHYREMEA
jgi:NTP pyrophosphatase (non-canonical NTP hydrolase)